MTDKELLELAAKAAGYTLIEYFEETDDESSFFMACMPVMGYENEYPEYWTEEPWNPLFDRYDAFNLAVRLEITIHQWGNEVCACNQKGTVNESVDCSTDPYAATCRAIVLAAAEIGREMP